MTIMFCRRGLFSLIPWALLIWGSAAIADEPVQISEHRDWGIYAYHQAGTKQCYLATYPVSRRGQTDGWGDSWLLVTNEPLSGYRHTVSFTLGRMLKPGSVARATVGKQTFELLAEGDTAWAAEDGSNLRLLVAMKRGRRVVVSATAAGGERVLDSFSLMGFTKALDQTAKHCQQ